MTINKYTIQKIANLAHIKINDQQIKSLKNELNQILKFVEQLFEINTDNISLLNDNIMTTKTFNNDTPNNKNYINQIFKNTHSTDGKFFLVPKIIE